MRIVNWTKHDINVYNKNQEHVVTIPPSGYDARIAVSSEQTGKVEDVNNLPLFKTVIVGKPYLADNNNKHHNLPQPDNSTIYIVSGFFRSYYDRKDLYQPGPLIRNDSGQPIGCIGLSR